MFLNPWFATPHGLPGNQLGSNEMSSTLKNIIVYHTICVKDHQHCHIKEEPESKPGPSDLSNYSLYLLIYISVTDEDAHLDKVSFLLTT